MRIGVALGSGGARGWCHVGVLRALDELGVRPGVVAGCSMGALVGAAHAAGRLAELERWARGLTRAGVLSLIDLRISGGGLVEGGGIRRLLGELEIPARIEDLAVPFVAVATDLGSGREIWLREGPLVPAVRASAALPGVFAPVEVDGRWLFDGGLVNPVPVSACRALGADVVIAVNPNARLTGQFWQADIPAPAAPPAFLSNLPEPLRALWSRPGASGPVAPPYLEVMSCAIGIMTEQIRRSRLAGEPPHVLLNAALADLSVLEFHRAAEAIDEGRRIVAAQADWIRACVAGEG